MKFRHIVAMNGDMMFVWNELDENWGWTEVICAREEDRNGNPIWRVLQKTDWLSTGYIETTSEKLGKEGYNVVSLQG